LFDFSVTLHTHCNHLNTSIADPGGHTKHMCVCVRFLGVKDCFYDVLSSLIIYLQTCLLDFWVLNVVVFYEILSRLVSHL